MLGDDRNYQLLRAFPGVSLINALTLLAEACVLSGWLPRATTLLWSGIWSVATM